MSDTLKKQLVLTLIGMVCAAGIGMTAQSAKTLTEAMTAMFWLAMTIGVALAATIIIHDKS